VLNVGSGLIYAAIIVMWAAYFIPRWLRRHEELSESRSVEKFDHAMRILSRREPTPDQRYVVMPARPDEPERPRRRRTPVPATEVRPPSRPVSVPRRTSARERSLAVRRRRVLAALVLLAVAAAVATPLTPLPWWVPVVLVLVTLGDLLHLRMQERRRAQLSRDREKVRRRTHSRLQRVDSAERLEVARRMLAERRAAAEAERVEAEWAAHEAARLAGEAADAAGWQPTPVPLPTYVTKPKAPRYGRAGGLGAGAHSGATVAQGQEPFDQTLAAQVPAAHVRAQASDEAKDAAFEELDAILDGRRAVND
jgi:hypothetical protein